MPYGREGQVGAIKDTGIGVPGTQGGAPLGICGLTHVSGEFSSQLEEVRLVPDGTWKLVALKHPNNSYGPYAEAECIRLTSITGLPGDERLSGLEVEKTIAPETAQNTLGPGDLGIFVGLRGQVAFANIDVSVMNRGDSVVFSARNDRPNDSLKVWMYGFSWDDDQFQVRFADPGPVSDRFCWLGGLLGQFATHVWVKLSNVNGSYELQGDKGGWGTVQCITRDQSQ